MDIDAVVWFPDRRGDAAWLSGRVVGQEDGLLRVRPSLTDDEVFELRETEARVRNTFDGVGGGPASAADVEDLITLTHLHEPAILHSLSERFDMGERRGSDGRVVVEGLASPSLR